MSHEAFTSHEHAQGVRRAVERLMVVANGVDIPDAPALLGQLADWLVLAKHTVDSDDVGDDPIAWANREAQRIAQLCRVCGALVATYPEAERRDAELAIAAVVREVPPTRPPSVTTEPLPEYAGVLVAGIVAAAGRAPGVQRVADALAAYNLEHGTPPLPPEVAGGGTTEQIAGRLDATRPSSHHRSLDRIRRNAAWLSAATGGALTADQIRKRWDRDRHTPRLTGERSYPLGWVCSKYPNHKEAITRALKSEVPVDGGGQGRTRANI
ncbi:MAG: hypothetical protein AAGI54_02530 [Planctomycetota bacterium]